MAAPVLHRLWHPPRLLLPHLRSITLSAYKRDVFDVKTEEEFQDRVMDSRKPVVVDFHAEWCSPCKDLTPLLTKVVESRRGVVDLAKVNIEELQELAIAHEVSAVPTVWLVRNGEIVNKFVGLQPENLLDKFVPTK